MAHGWQEGLDLNKHPVSIYKMWLCPDVDVDKGHPAHILLDLKGHLGLAVITFEQGMLVPLQFPLYGWFLYSLGPVEGSR